GAGTRSSAPGTAHKFAALGTASLFSFGAAFRLSSLRYDLLRLIRANQTLCQERFGRLRDRGDVLAMIFPRPARRRTVAWRDLLDAPPVCVHDGAGNSARAQIQRVRNSILVGIRFAGERDRAIERSLPVMSVPMRSQSGASASLRIQLCRSGANGMPGATIGLG